MGHKQTFAVQKGMSALPPKADMCAATRDVRFVPIADIAVAANHLCYSAITGGGDDEKAAIRLFAVRSGCVASAHPSAAANEPNHRFHEWPIA